jgi:hypothetical protein
MPLAEGYRSTVSPNDLLIVVPIVVAIISFLAAVVAVVIGQLLGQWFQLSADKRRWLREDAVRRRTRSEEMARQAIEEIAKVVDFVGWSAGYARGKAAGREQTYVPAPAAEVSELCRPIRRAALEIDDDAVRAHLDKVCDVLPNGPIAESVGGPHPARAAWAVQQTSEALVSAYLRGVPLPAVRPELLALQFKVFDRAYSAVEDVWSMYDPEED